jgi:glycine cleavage system H protein
MNIPANLKYTEDHEWIKVEGNLATIGITDYAQQQLGDIVFVEIETLDEQLPKGGTFGTVEAVKTVSDLFMPAGGKVIEVNPALNDNPEIVNSDPYNAGWMIKIELTNPAELNDLLSAEAYKEIIG